MLWRYLHLSHDEIQNDSYDSVVIIELFILIRVMRLSSLVSITGGILIEKLFLMFTDMSKSALSISSHIESSSSSEKIISGTYSIRSMGIEPVIHNSFPSTSNMI